MRRWRETGDEGRVGGGREREQGMREGWEEGGRGKQHETTVVVRLRRANVKFTYACTCGKLSLLHVHAYRAQSHAHTHACTRSFYLHPLHTSYSCYTMYMYMIACSRHIKQKATQHHHLRRLTFSSFQRNSELPHVGFKPTSLLL